MSFDFFEFDMGLSVLFCLEWDITLGLNGLCLEDVLHDLRCSNRALLAPVGIMLFFPPRIELPRNEVATGIHAEAGGSVSWLVWHARG